MAAAASVAASGHGRRSSLVKACPGAAGRSRCGWARSGWVGHGGRGLLGLGNVRRGGLGEVWNGLSRRG